MIDKEDIEMFEPQFSFPEFLPPHSTLSPSLADDISPFCCPTKRARSSLRSCGRLLSSLLSNSGSLLS